VLTGNNFIHFLGCLIFMKFFYMPIINNEIMHCCNPTQYAKSKIALHIIASRLVLFADQSSSSTKL
jgi:hypothetical protein